MKHKHNKHNIQTTASESLSPQAEMDKLRSEENALYTKSKAEMYKQTKLANNQTY